MLATLEAVGTYVDSVPTTDRPAWRAQVLSFLNTRADILSAGESPDGVWAITRDGVPLALWNNRLPDPPDPEEVVEASAFSLRTQTPGNITARFSTTVGTGFTRAGPRLGQQLGAHGYAPTYDMAPLESLKGQRNESVFFFNTHGGAFVLPDFDGNGHPLPISDPPGPNNWAYGLWSGTKIDPVLAADPSYHTSFMAEARAKRLAVVRTAASNVPNGSGFLIPVNEWRYAITPAWVHQYLKFPKENHVSVWIAACMSGSPGAAPMRNAFRTAGAEMVSSWKENVKGEAISSATSFLFDRLLGANQILPPATPQRPFSYDECWTELRSRGLHKHPTVDDAGEQQQTEIVYEGAAGDDAFGLFAPSVAYALIDEVSDQAHLIGIFGTPPADKRKITIGGADAAVISWEPRKIVCALARTGAGSAGDVQVIVHGIKSNVRRITRWTLEGAYEMTEEGTPHEIDGSLRLIFRADVGEYRKNVGNVFIRPTRWAVAARSSDVQLDAKGILAFPCGPSGGTETITWEGSGRFPTLYDPNVNEVTIAQISLNTIDQTGGFGLAFGLRDPDLFPLRMKIKDCEGQSFNFPVAPGPSGPVTGTPLMFSSPLDELLPDGTRLEYQLPGGSFTLGSDWAISAGAADSGADSGMKWIRAAPEFPPDSAAAR
jgi:hypothetical protein